MVEELAARELHAPSHLGHPGAERAAAADESVGARPRGLSNRGEGVLLVTGAAGLLGGRLAALLAAELRGRWPASLAPAPVRLCPPVALDLPRTRGHRRARFETARPDAVAPCGGAGRRRSLRARPGGRAPCQRATAPRPRGRGVRAARRAPGRALHRPGVRRATAPRGRDEDASRGPLLALRAHQARRARRPPCAAARAAPSCASPSCAAAGTGREATASEAVAWALAPGRAACASSPTSSARRSTPSRWPRPWPRLLRGGGAGPLPPGRPGAGQPLRAGPARGRGLRARPPRPSRPSTPGRRLRWARRGPPTSSLDSSRARRELGCAPRPLDEAIRDGRPSGPPV